MRVGIGYDVHRYENGRDLVMGGVKIPYSKGLLGHSDADVLIHAIMDSLLGAASLRDIGYYFPDAEEKYKDISSILLLNKVKILIYESGFFIENIDSIIIAQNPKMSPYIPLMIKNISLALEISESQVSVKATTEEGLGFSGREEGIAAKAICLLNNRR